MCFGQESADYRVEAFPAYHADRPPMPDPLAHQWERAPAFYEALGWKVMSHDELEADDLMHSCASPRSRRAARLHPHGRPRHVPVRDRHVHVLMQRARQEGPDDMGPDEVLEAYGVTPEQVPDFIALRGDPSDGLPGAKGIGAKTAADLLKRKGDLEHVILGAIREKPAVRRALIEQADELRSFRDIATLRTVAVDLPPDTPTDYAGGPRPRRARHGPAREAPRARGRRYG